MSGEDSQGDGSPGPDWGEDGSDGDSNWVEDGPGDGSAGDADWDEDGSGDESGRDSDWDEDGSGGGTERGEGHSAPGGSDVTHRPGPDEVFCYSCGEVIKERAEICPECGVRQRAPPGESSPPPGASSPPRQGDPGLTTKRQRKLEKAANNDHLSTFVLSLFVPPLAYVEVGKPGYAALNFLTANYLFLGFILVPFHTYATIDDARQELRTEGVRGY